jgi:hypothetical protein
MIIYNNLTINFLKIEKVIFFELFNTNYLIFNEIIFRKRDNISPNLNIVIFYFK